MIRRRRQCCSGLSSRRLLIRRTGSSPPGSKRRATGARLSLPWRLQRHAAIVGVVARQRERGKVRRCGTRGKPSPRGVGRLAHARLFAVGRGRREMWRRLRRVRELSPTAMRGSTGSTTRRQERSDRLSHCPHTQCPCPAMRLVCDAAHVLHVSWSSLREFLDLLFPC